jgi:hypothetical protein
VLYPFKFNENFEKSYFFNLGTISAYYPSTAPFSHTVALTEHFDISIPLNAIDMNLEIFGKPA